MAKDNPKRNDGTSIGVVGKVIAIAIIVVFLYVCYYWGGDGQGWYRGKP